MNGEVPALVLGGTGYVAGELLRLLAGHPYLSPFAVLLESQAGGMVESAFPHLTGCFPDLTFSDRKELPGLIAGKEKLAVLCAAPHAAAAPLLDELLTAADGAGTVAKVVDISADFRFADAAAYEQVYGHAHGAPNRLSQ